MIDTMAYGGEDMTNRSLTEVLAHEGIADLTGLWPVEQVEDWNRRLDPLFAEISDQPRSLVGPDQLVDSGIFQELFSEPARRLIAGIQPSALLYHCQCYEIAAAQSKSHIHQDRVQGWHRDSETIMDFTDGFPTFVSIFILLSPVGDEDGPFEFTPNRPAVGLRPRGKVVRLVGPTGTAAIWNRSYFHRAAPNRGPRRRRILKVSFQPAGLRNELIQSAAFKTAWSNLDQEPLRALVDHRRVGTTAPLVDAGAPMAARPMPAKYSNDLGVAAVAFERLQAVGRRLNASRQRQLVET